MQVCGILRSSKLPKNIMMEQWKAFKEMRDWKDDVIQEGNAKVRERTMSGRSGSYSTYRRLSKDPTPTQ